MATFLKETSFPSGNGSHFRLKMYLDSYSQSVANNRTTARFHIYFVSVDGYYGSGASAIGYIGGVQTGSTTSVGKNATVDMGYRDITFNHNADGKGSYGWSCSISCPWGIGNASLSGTWTAPTIPRKSTIGNKTATIGQPINITWNRASTSFKHTLVYKFGNVTETLGTNLDTSISWTPSNDLYQYMIDNKTKTGTLTLTTYSGSTNLGSTTSTLTLNADENVVKNVLSNISYEDINTRTLNLTNDSSYIVDGYSDLNVRCDITTKEYATLKKITYKGADITSFATFQELVGNDSKYTLSFAIQGFRLSDEEVITITDSRNIDNQFTITIDNLINYFPISINAKMWRRNPTSSEILSNFTGNYFNSKFKDTDNTIQISFKYKLENDEEYSREIALVKDLDYQVVNNTILSGNDDSEEKQALDIVLNSQFDYRNKYGVVLIYEDSLSSGEVYIPVNRGIPIINWNGEKLNVNGDITMTDIDTGDIVSLKERLGSKNTIQTVSLTRKTTNLGTNSWVDTATAQNVNLSAGTYIIICNFSITGSTSSNGIASGRIVIDGNEPAISRETLYLYGGALISSGSITSTYTVQYDTQVSVNCQVYSNVGSKVSYNPTFTFIKLI